MAALTTSRSTPRMGEAGLKIALGIATATTLYQGGIICRNAGGFLTPGATSTTLVAVGVLQSPTPSISNPGANGAVTAEVEGGIYKFANSAAADLITNADVGNVCYVVDDQTLARTNGSNTRSVAGAVVAVEPDGVWVEISVLGRKA